MGDAVQETVQDTEPDRWLQLEGLDNVRDAGGLPLRDGGRTRFGELLRSANLRYVTDDDVAHLVDVVRPAAGDRPADRPGDRPRRPDARWRRAASRPSR